MYSLGLIIHRRNTTKVAERYSVRDNIVAAIICGLFLDIGRITATDRSQIINGCAVKRQRD